jgi:hypothetical protein
MGSVSAIFSGESPILHRFLAMIRYLRLVAISLCRWFFDLGGAGLFFVILW